MMSGFSLRNSWMMSGMHAAAIANRNHGERNATSAPYALFTLFVRYEERATSNGSDVSNRQ